MLLHCSNTLGRDRKYSWDVPHVCASFRATSGRLTGPVTEPDKKWGEGAWGRGREGGEGSYKKYVITGAMCVAPC